MDDQVWMKNPFQLLDFILIGEKHVTPNKVTNALARIGLGTALVMALLGYPSWWMIGLGILFISLLYHCFTVYSSTCSTLDVNVYEGFKPTQPTSYVETNNNETADIEFIEEPRVHASTTEISLNASQNYHNETSGNWNDFKSRVYDMIEDAEVNERDEQINNTKNHLQLNLTPDDFATNFFEPYTIYQPREAIYASMSSV